MLMPPLQAAALHDACFLPTATVWIALDELVLLPEQLVQPEMETSPRPHAALVAGPVLLLALALMTMKPLVPSVLVVAV
jgi:hypothetical protein